MLWLLIQRRLPVRRSAARLGEFGFSVPGAARAGDRTLGQARAHLETVHAHVGYDVEVDTSLADQDECAGVVTDAIATYRGPSQLLALR